jgi:Leucine-rich repeat (LRR) protein
MKHSVGDTNDFVDVNNQNLGNIFPVGLQLGKNSGENVKFLYIRGNNLLSLWDMDTTPNLQVSKKIWSKLLLLTYLHISQILDFSENKISSLKGLENLRSLRQLYANWNCLHALSELAALPNLEILSVTGNAIASLHGMIEQV